MEGHFVQEVMSLKLPSLEIRVLSAKACVSDIKVFQDDYFDIYHLYLSNTNSNR
jgi:hypothetical protein